MTKKEFEKLVFELSKQVDEPVNYRVYETLGEQSRRQPRSGECTSWHPTLGWERGAGC